MTWDYRVMRTFDTDKKTQIFGVHEVYYKKNGNIEMWTADAVEPSGQTFTELYSDFVHYGRAFSQPVLLVNLETTAIEQATVLGTPTGVIVWKKKKQRRHTATHTAKPKKRKLRVSK